MGVRLARWPTRYGRKGRVTYLHPTILRGAAVAADTTEPEAALARQLADRVYEMRRDSFRVLRLAKWITEGLLEVVNPTDQ